MTNPYVSPSQDATSPTSQAVEREWVDAAFRALVFVEAISMLTMSVVIVNVQKIKDAGIYVILTACVFVSLAAFWSVGRPYPSRAFRFWAVVFSIVFVAIAIAFYFEIVVGQIE